MIIESYNYLLPSNLNKEFKITMSRNKHTMVDCKSYKKQIKHFCNIESEKLIDSLKEDNNTFNIESDYSFKIELNGSVVDAAITSGLCYDLFSAHI